MNIFVFSEYAPENARFHPDKYVIKMPVEHTQMLSANIKLLSGETGKIAWINHPCTKWLRESVENLDWLFSLTLELGNEYKRRYNTTKDHASVVKFKELFWDYISLFPEIPKTKFAQAMPEECKNTDPTLAYQSYFNKHKQHLASWKNSETPYWFSPQSS